MTREIATDNLEDIESFNAKERKMTKTRAAAAAAATAAERHVVPWVR